MGVIIFNLLVIVICTLALISDVSQKEWGWAALMLFLVFLNSLFLAANISKVKNENEVTTTVIQEVKGYQIDSTIMINGTDTTKTYTLTYWK